jgi:hypothetical protein
MSTVITQGRKVVGSQARSASSTEVTAYAVVDN